jgi:UDP-2,3-diacylglucosamine hydrolase
MIKLFISDLHLEESRPDISDIFFRFLQRETKQADALYILGDFFEAWIGDDDQSAFSASVVRALNQASRHLPIFIMHGNRDFLLGRKFMRSANCRLLPDEIVIQAGSSPTLLMHGDTLCTADIAYQKFRKRSRIWLLQKLFLLKSLEKRRGIAAGMREKSKRYTSTAPEYVMDVTHDEVTRVMRKHNVRHLIHGHTHRPDVHHLEVEGSHATRTVLAPWHEEGSVLICEDSGKKEFRILK